MSYGSQHTDFQPYSSWDWFNQGVQPYFGSYYIEYATPKYLVKSLYCKDHFDQNQSRAQPKKKVVKYVYHGEIICRYSRCQIWKKGETAQIYGETAPIQNRKKTEMLKFTKVARK